MRKLLLLFLLVNPLYGQVRSECADPNIPCTPVWWDSNTEQDVDRYNLYRSTVDCTDPEPEPISCPSFAKVGANIPQGPSLTTPRFIDNNVEFGVDYIYAATALNTSGLESPFSNRLGVKWDNPNRPSPPGGLRGIEQGAQLRLDWNDPPPLEQVNSYTIRKGSSDQGPGGIIAHVSVSEYRDLNPGRAGPKFYWVTATSDFGIESPPSGPVLYRGRLGQDARGNPRR